MVVEKVQEIAAQVKAAVEEQLPAILSAVQRYLRHTGTKTNRLNIINTLRVTNYNSFLSRVI